MGNLTSYRQKIKELEGLINELSEGRMSIEDLTKLEQLTRELHERSIILKYKAYETKVNGSVIEKEETTEESFIPEPEKTNPELGSKSPESEEQPTIEFSLFDDVPEIKEQRFNPTESIVDPEPMVQIESHFSETVSHPTPDEEIIQTVIESRTEFVAPIQQESFIDRLNIQDNSLGTSFFGSKLNSLIGAFGLNEKLRFINDLFDGSSESFSDAVKALDNQPSINEANQKLTQYAEQFNWDPEDDAVIEFVSFINRRYA